MSAAALAIALATAVGVGPVLLAGVPPMLVAVPDEPGAQVLTETPAYQAVAVDLDGDSVREVVALVRGGGTSILAGAWRASDDGWVQIGRPAEVVPRGTAEQAALRWPGAPLRLLVRRVAGGDRLTLVRQPSSAEPDLDLPCCLLLHDLVVADGALRLVPVAPFADAVDAVFVLDLDGDGTDELVTTRSVPALRDTSHPTATAVYRWNGAAFDAPTVRQLPVGSGDTPFLLGDTDGVGGSELGLIATRGRPALYRVRLGPDGELVADDAGIVATAALAVPAAGARGVAVLGGSGLSLHRWPVGGPLDPALVSVPFDEGTFLGTVELAGEERLLIRQTAGADRLHVLGLPDLTAPRFGAVTHSLAAATFASGPVTPYVGPLPGGTASGDPAIIYAGRLLSADAPVDLAQSGVASIAAMAGAQPIGLVGPAAATLALLHSPVDVPPIDPAGGRLDPPLLHAPSAVTVAPFSLTRQPEVDASLEPPAAGGVVIGSRGALAVGAEGFTARVDAPPGSRVYVGAGDPSVFADFVAVPEGGSIEVALVPPAVTSPNPRYRAALSVTTPAGHAYLATWDVRVLLAAPRLDAVAVTAFASGQVEVNGRTSPLAEAAVAGHPVDVDATGRFVARVALPPWPTVVNVTAIDPLGNVARTSVTGVGWFDYRGLPWIPIVAALVAAAAVILYLRVPRIVPAPRRADDDAALEEIEPD
jgi:hypothetical protein